MSEHTEAGQGVPAADRPPPNVGDLLRQARESRHLSVNVVARDLKLNGKYIESLEANQFDALPADPYVRVYIRSLARYLMLDPEAVLKRYQETRGISSLAPVHETSTKIDVSKVDGDKTYGPWIVIFVVIALLAGISFIASKRGWTGSSQTSTTSTSTAAAADSTHDSTAAAPAVADSTPQDSTGAESAPVQAPIENDTILDSSIAVHDSVPPAAGSRLSMTIRAVKDSSWVQVFSDGVSWKNTLKQGNYKSFSAKDSLNVHVGNCSALEFTVNRKLVKKFSETGVAAFMVNKAGLIFTWSLARYQSVFSMRM